MLPQTHPEKVIHAFQQLDIQKVNKLLLEKFDYQDMPKEVFIEKLGVAFALFKQGGDTSLLLEEGRCAFSLCRSRHSFSKCNQAIMHKAYCFIGNKTRSHLDVIFEACGPLFSGPDYIIEIHDCSSLKLKNENVILGKLIEIDPKARE